jgi:hypothetical protein
MWFSEGGVLSDSPEAMLQVEEEFFITSHAFCSCWDTLNVCWIV